jgi:4-hydroxyphenylpyruvate dioxygenase
MAPSRLSPSILTPTGETFPLYSNGTSNPSHAVQAPSPSYHGYHHVTWWVGNAKQAASYYITRMGFRPIAYAGLETGARAVASHVVENGGVRFVFCSPIRAGVPAGRRGDGGRTAVAGKGLGQEDEEMVREMHAHLEQHGDAVKDVAFEVDDVRGVYARAVARGAVSVSAPMVLRDAYNGEVVVAQVKTYGDTTHTFVEKNGYQGVFMPGFKKWEKVDPLVAGLPECSLQAIDHCVGNQDWDEMEEACDL